MVQPCSCSLLKCSYNSAYRPSPAAIFLQHLYELEPPILWLVLRVKTLVLCVSRRMRRIALDGFARRIKRCKKKRRNTHDIH